MGIIRYSFIQISLLIIDIIDICKTMARTKQTARKTTIKLVPRAQLVAQRIARKSTAGKGGKGTMGGKAVMQSESEDLENLANTQQFSLRFDDQDKCEQEAVEAKLIVCRFCAAYFTRQSILIRNDEYETKKNDKELSDIDRQKYLDTHQNVWICEFCLTHNSIPADYEVPKAENPCIILEKSEPRRKDIREGTEKMLIFCIDISGSMDMSFEGKTRLQSVKEAIVDEVNRLHYEKEVIKIGIISFGNQVTLIGDGSDFKSKVLPTNLYKDFDGIIKQIRKVNSFCHPLEKSYNPIKKTISSLSVHGSTALGPGLLAAVELASKGSTGSKVILCTDGEANVGMGGSCSDDRLTFYTKMADHAKNRGVMVNILSLKGDNCNLKELGKLSLATGGVILKIDPKMLGTQFSKIVKENVIGTESKLVIKLNKIFKICNAKSDEISPDETTLIQNFGNFTSETQLNFQFDSVSKEEAEKIAEIDKNLFKCQKVPMQIQLTYVGRNNWTYLQIVTDWRELTENPNDIYEGANFCLFAASVLQRASLKIREAKFDEAESIFRGYWSIVNEKFSKTEPEFDLNRFAERVKRLERVLNSKKNKLIPRSDTKERMIHSGGRGGRGGRGRNNKKRSRSRSRGRSNSADSMASDSENEVLFKEARARERSRSRSKDKDKKAPKKEREVSRSRSRSRSRDKNSKKDKKKSAQAPVPVPTPSTRPTRMRK